MQNVLMIRATVKPDQVGTVGAAVGSNFAALEQRPPAGMRYAVSKLADGVTFVILLALAQGIQNPLDEVPAYRAFLGNLEEWLVGPPTQEQLTVVGSYDLS
jgi:hypothetical protein